MTFLLAAVVGYLVYRWKKNFILVILAMMLTAGAVTVVQNQLLDRVSTRGRI